MNVAQFTITLNQANVESDGESEVEVCAGTGNLSRAVQRCGFNVKAFDVPWILYSGMI